MISRSSFGRGALFMLLSGLAAAAPAAEMKDLIGRLPGEANAIAVLDVERILKTPLAQKEGWKARITDAYGKQPFIVAPGAMHVVMAALIDPTTMDSLWEVAVMDLDAAPAVAAIARGEGGLVDTVADKQAAWSPMNAYFIQLEPQMLATVAPANRQFAARLARKRGTLAGAFMSQYLQSAAASLETGTEFALAIDLEDVVAPRRAMLRAKAGEFQCLAGKKDADLDAIIKTLASLKGLTLRVEIADDVKGRCSVDFGTSAAPLADIGKPLLLEVLSAVGARLDDLENWTASARGNALILEGKLSHESLRRLFELIQPPAPAEVQAAPRPAAPEGAPPKSSASGESSTAVASQKYFQSVDGIVDRLGKSLGAGAKNVGLADSAAWMQRDAKRISRLPIKDVDPDLVAWGALVSEQLRTASDSMTQGGLQAKGRSAGVQGSYVDNFDDQANTDNANELARVEGQRRQAAHEARAAAVEGASGAIRQITSSRDQIRAEMVKRYKIDF